jgi:hypothetical protein
LRLLSVPALLTSREHKSIHRGFERSSSGSLAIFAAIRRASSRVSNFAADRRHVQYSKAVGGLSVPTALP